MGVVRCYACQLSGCASDSYRSIRSGMSAVSNRLGQPACRHFVWLKPVRMGTAPFRWRARKGMHTTTRDTQTHGRERERGMSQGAARQTLACSRPSDHHSASAVRRGAPSARLRSSCVARPSAPRWRLAIRADALDAFRLIRLELRQQWYGGRRLRDGADRRGSLRRRTVGLSVRPLVAAARPFFPPAALPATDVANRCLLPRAGFPTYPAGVSL